MDSTRNRFVVGIGIIVVAVGYLVTSATADTKNYFYTVGELHDVIEVGEKDVTTLALRVMGHVQVGSIDRKPEQAITRFVITDPENPDRELPVVYRKVGVPDTFKDKAEAVVEGRYTPDGVFEAEVLMAKCPSKYEAQGDEHPGGGYPGGESPDSGYSDAPSSGADTPSENTPLDV